MPYGPWDEYFLHQLPRTFDHVHDTERSWSDRCYFNAHAPDGSLLIATGYGNNPNTQRAHGYVKVTLADGRHWDLDAHRASGGDRADLHAGPMRWTCVEPLEKWTLELGPNDSGIEYELHYASRAPLWELKPIEIWRGGRIVADMTHIKQSARYTGWVQVDGERIPVDGFHGGRDRTFGVRVAERVNFWIWFSAEFEDRSLEAWVWEDGEGNVEYVDGGFTHEDGTLSKPFVRFEHDITFDGNSKRAVAADLLFVDVDGKEFPLTATTSNPLMNVYHGGGLPAKHSDGALLHTAWNGHDAAELQAVEDRTVSVDQLMTFDMGGQRGTGIVELLIMDDGYRRYPEWAPIDIAKLMARG